MIEIIVSLCIIALFVIAFVLLAPPQCADEPDNNMRLSMRALIRWEQFNKKAFSQFDNSNEDDLLSLFYVCSLPELINVSFAEFKKDLNARGIHKMASAFNRQSALISQFKNELPKQSEDTQAGEVIYVKDTVSALVLAGLDVYFAYNDMDFNDYQLFVQAYHQQHKERALLKRHEIFWLLSPHFTNNKIKSPKDLYLFDWEAAHDAIEHQKQAAEAAQEFLSFMNPQKQQ